MRMCHTTIYSHRTRASAVVELLILLPVVLLILIALMYFGQASLFRGRLNFAAEYAMDTPGDQSETPDAPETVSQIFYPTPVGKLTVTEYAPDPSECPTTGELRQMFEDMVQPIYSTYAVGRYVLANGQLQFVVSTHQSSYLSQDGQFVLSAGLLNGNIPELTQQEMQDWQVRNRVEMTYSFKPEYVSIGRWALEPEDLTLEYQSTVRTDKVREAAQLKLDDVDALTGNPNMTDRGQLPRANPLYSTAMRFW